MRMRSLTILLTAIISSTAIAAVPNSVSPGASAESRMYGQAAPFNLEDLPRSKLKTQLEALPNPARERAMAWLNSFSFPANDIAKLNVDKRGAVFYVDDVLPEEITQADLEADPTQAGISPEDAFSLHSKPGAANVVYVNFVGYKFSGTGWNNKTGVTEYQALPYDTDGNITNFSASERAAIGEIWHRIAEDYAPFDIDVTTEAPKAFGPNVAHILVTKSKDAKGDLLPSSGAGGTAYVNVWGRSDFPTYQPALVYYNNLGNGHATYVAEAASHELGHNLGLSHDGTSSTNYYKGHGAGLTSWAPIMGSSYYANVTQWSKGEYSGANNTQDDLSIISSKLRYRDDDHGDTKSSSTALLVDGKGFIASSNPEFDPLNVRSDNKGIIESATDSDVFYFDTASGDLNIMINPAWDAYTRSSLRGANLDIKATLFDDLGTVLVSDLINDTNAVVSANVTAGRYYLAISGNASSSYSDYASLSQYYISGSVVPPSPDLTAPSPSPSLFTEATSRTTIAMSSTVSVDDSGIVEYQFICSAGGTGCVASRWQSGTSYTASGLASNSSYSYQVKARDASGNETILSDIVTATTELNNTPVSTDDNQVEVIENTPTPIDVLANDFDADGDPLHIDSFSVPQHGNLAINNDKVIYTADPAYVGNDSFSYSVSDGYGGYATGNVNLSVIATVTPDPIITGPSVPLDPSALSTVLVKTGKGKDKVVTSAALNWVDNSNNETHFEIERCVEEITGRGKNRVISCTFELYEIVGQNTTEFTIATESGYKYRVKAVNGEGDSGYTNEVSI